MVRTQYITVQELNEILGTDIYDSDHMIHIYEASEVIEYNLFNPLAKWSVSDTPKEIKLATAYQFKFMEINDLFNEEIGGGNYSLGEFSTSGNNNTSHNKDLSKRAAGYLVMSGWVNRSV